MIVKIAVFVFCAIVIIVVGTAITLAVTIVVDVVVVVVAPTSQDHCLFIYATPSSQHVIILATCV